MTLVQGIAGGLIVVAALFIYLVIVPLLEGMIEYMSRPREPMEWCHKHGFFRKAQCIPITPTVMICPTCYLESISGKKAERL
jgi:hypothetical protein